MERVVKVVVEDTAVLEDAMVHSVGTRREGVTGMVGVVDRAVKGVEVHGVMDIVGIPQMESGAIFLVLT